MARILVIKGKNKGESFSLDVDQNFVGRESKNNFVINDVSISRRHFLIARQDSLFVINDLQSLNGTTVNGKNAENLILQHGDKIHAGDFVFLFLESDQEISPVSNAIHFNQSSLDLTKTVRLNIDEIISAMARDLSALLQISAKINSVNSLENLQNELLKQIFGVIPAREGAILFVDKVGELAEVFGINREDEIENINISQTIVKQVLAGNEAILVNELANDIELNQAKSLVFSNTSSVLCVPLTLFEKKLGVIYLSTSQNHSKFDESHLRFLTAVAGISAVAIENIRNIEFLERENARLREEILLERNMIGDSEAIKKVFNVIAKVAPTDSTVLITGESGTGKELAARAIHQNSKRKDKPFIAINCAALNETLLESELFGHERGAFTGAIAQKKGKIELAQSGTLFLDEIGEMAQSLQAKILRVLQEREYERIGGIKTLKADIRLITATNRDLETEIKSGNFRQDLFYRLNVVSFKMPPLRDRKEDILTLAENFVEKFAKKINRPMRGISGKARKLLQNYNFPGNVRELENTIERAVVLGSDEWLLPEDLPENLWESVKFEELENNPTELNYYEAIQNKKSELIFKAFIEAKGSYVEAAKILDVHPNYLHRLIRNLDIKEKLENSLR